MSMPQVFAIAAYSKGFACSAGPGRVLLFEKVEDKDFYRESREIRVRRKQTGSLRALFSSHALTEHFTRKDWGDTVSEPRPEKLRSQETGLGFRSSNIWI